MGHEEKTKRYLMIDFTRFIAIILMIIFHFSFDMTMLGFFKIDFQHNEFWFAFPRLIVFLFMICVGMSLRHVHHDVIKWQSIKTRTLKLGLFALIISAVTYFMFPKQWIYFGILHSILVCSLIALPFLRFPKISLIIGLSMVIMYWPMHLRFTPLSRYLNIKSLDYIPFHPWFGVVLIGIFLHSVNFHKIKLPRFLDLRIIKFMSKHSLIIYLIHQPILYGSISLVKFFLK